MVSGICLKDVWKACILWSIVAQIIWAIWEIIGFLIHAHTLISIIIDLENSLEKVIKSDVKLIVKNLSDPNVMISRCDTRYCSKFLNFQEGHGWKMRISFKSSLPIIYNERTFVENKLEHVIFKIACKLSKNHSRDFKMTSMTYNWPLLWNYIIDGNFDKISKLAKKQK